MRYSAGDTVLYNSTKGIKRDFVLKVIATEAGRIYGYKLMRGVEVYYEPFHTRMMLLEKTLKRFK